MENLIPKLVNLKFGDSNENSPFDDDLNNGINKLNDRIDELNSKIKFIYENEKIKNKINDIFNIIENLKYDKQSLENRVKHLEIENITLKEKINNLEEINNIFCEFFRR